MGRALKSRLKRADARFHCARRPFLGRPATHEIETTDWKLSYARCAGKSHVDSGVPCQDQVSARTYDDGVSVLVLADGAGSAIYSHYGAYMVVHRAMDMASEYFEEVFRDCHCGEGFKIRLIDMLQRSLQEAALNGINLTEEERLRYSEPSRTEALLVPCPVRSLSSTLLLVAMKGNKYFAVHLGDGVIGAEYTESNRKFLSVISGPENGEYANETYFVTSSGAAREAKFFAGRLDNGIRTISGFMLMSDGPEAVLYEKKTKRLAPACSKLFNANRSLEDEEMRDQLLSTMESVIRQRTSDDCSLAIATRA